MALLKDSPYPAPAVLALARLHDYPAPALVRSAFAVVLQCLVGSFELQ